MVSRCEDSTVTGDFVDELPNLICTSILFPSLKNIQEESDVEKFIEGEENANTKNKTFYDL